MTRAADRLRRFRDWIEAVEETWLGWTHPPTRRVLSEVGWRPDSAADYCARCGGSVGPGEERRDTGCASCRGVSVGTDAVVRLGRYRGELREWIRAIKYRGWAEMAETLGRRLGGALGERPAGAIDPRRAVVVPMPMPWQRRVYRGIDHARVIALGAAAELDVPTVSILTKTNGPPQVSLPASDRSRRSGGMRLSRRARRIRLDDMVVVLVDDVRTSGASLKAAARLIRRLRPRRVVAGVLAVTDDPSRRPIAPGRTTRPTPTRVVDGARTGRRRPGGPGPPGSV